MTEPQIEVPAAPKKPAKKRAKAKRAKPAAAAPAQTKSPFVGISTTKCCTGCTEDRCLISTVATCKHPFKTGDSGCGPVTMTNRAAAKRLIKHQQIDA